LQVNTLGYRPWTGKIGSPWVRWLPIARRGLLGIVRRRIFWLFFLLGLLNFLFHFAVIYFIAQIESEVRQRGGSLPPMVRNMVFTGNGQSYRDFIFGQSTVVMLLLGFAGALLIGNDFRFHSVAFYLSKPIGKLHYLAGKLGAAAGLTALITLVPALVLFIEYGAFTESLEYFRESQRIFWAILGYGLLVSLLPAVLILGIAALFQRTIPIVVAWGAIFAFLPLVSEMLRTISPGNPWQWDLLSFWDVLRWISNCLFGIETEKYLDRLPESLAVVAAWVGLSLWAFWRRVQAVEVVR
jgi:ABC-2 type transport system permease protein